MMPSLHNAVKYLRLVNIKTALNTAKELHPKLVKDVSRQLDIVSMAKIISFSPRHIGLDLEIRDKRGTDVTKQDPLAYIPVINPRSILPLMENEWKREEVGLPTGPGPVVEKQAVRLIVIRRKKMKKHQRRKLWKRMRHRWARVKQRRRQVKEKVFQNGLLAMIKEAEEFSAEAYVAGKLQKANHTPLPTRWRGRRLPEFIIRQYMGLDPKVNYRHTDVYKAG